MKSSFHMAPKKLHEVPQGEYIYLIQPVKEYQNNTDVYKLGKTTQEPYKRMDGYPKSSILFLTIIVDDSTTAEKDLLALFRSKYVRDIRIGNEYFMGDVVEMMNDIMDYQREHFGLNSLEVKSQIRKNTLNSDDGLDQQAIANKKRLAKAKLATPVSANVTPTNESDDNDSDGCPDEDDIPDTPVPVPVDDPDDVPSDAFVDDDEVIIPKRNVKPASIKRSSSVASSKSSTSKTPSNLHVVESKLRIPKKMANGGPTTRVYRSQFKDSNTTSINKIGDEIVSLINNVKCEVDIYTTYYPSLNIFDIRKIDVMHLRKVVNSFDIKGTINSDSDLFNMRHIKLTPSQLKKFNLVYDENTKDYIIHIKSLKKRNWHGIKFYNHVYIPE